MFHEFRYVRPELGHCLSPMVAGYVVMQLFPKAFDGIVLRRVRRQKMELNASTELFEGALGFH